MNVVVDPQEASSCSVEGLILPFAPEDGVTAGGTVKLMLLCGEVSNSCTGILIGISAIGIEIV